MSKGFMVCISRMQAQLNGINQLMRELEGSPIGDASLRRLATKIESYNAQACLLAEDIERNVRERCDAEVLERNGMRLRDALWGGE